MGGIVGVAHGGECLPHLMPVGVTADTVAVAGTDCCVTQESHAACMSPVRVHVGGTDAVAAGASAIGQKITALPRSDLVILDHRTEDSGGLPGVIGVPSVGSTLDRGVTVNVGMQASSADSGAAVAGGEIASLSAETGLTVVGALTRATGVDALGSGRHGVTGHNRLLRR